MEKKLNTAQRISNIKKTALVVASVGLVAASIFVYQPKQSAKPLQEVSLPFKKELPLQHNLSNKEEVDKGTIKEAKRNYQETKVNHDKEEVLGNEALTIVNKKQPLLELTNTLNKDSVESGHENISAKAFDVGFITSSDYACLGNNISFEAKEKSSELSYLWDFGDGNISSKPNPTHTYEESGQYDVSLTLINKNTKEQYGHAVNNTIIIHPKPVVGFSWTEASLTHNNNKMKYPYVHFKAVIDQEYTCNWDFSNGETSYEKSPKVLFNTKGEYPTTLTIKDDLGCTNTITKEVTVKQSFVLNEYTPTVFKPTSNLAETKSFMPKAFLVWDVQFELSIKDKTGRLIYKTDDKNAPWNGRLDNSGGILTSGIYFWQAITIDSEGHTHHHLGKITLIK